MISTECLLCSGNIKFVSTVTAYGVRSFTAAYCEKCGSIEELVTEMVTFPVYAKMCNSDTEERS